MKLVRFSIVAAGLLFATTAIVAFWGFVAYSPPATASGVQNPDALDALWGTIALFTADLGAADPRYLPWQLDVARIVAPVLAAGGLVIAGWVACRRTFRRARLRYWSRRHTIVCGADERSVALARSAATGARVAIVAPELDDTALELQGLTALQGDFTDPALLASIAAARAAFITALGPDEAENTTIALAAADAGARRADRITRIVVNVRDPQRRAVLTAVGETAGIELIPVDLDELAAARVLQDLNTERRLPRHIVVVADRVRGVAILRRLAVLAGIHSVEFAVADAKPCVTLVGTEAQQALADATTFAPQLGALLDVEAVDAEAERVTADACWRQRIAARGHVERVVISNVSPVEGLILADAIGRLLDGGTITVDVGNPSATLDSRARAINATLRPAAIVRLVASEPEILTLDALAAQARVPRLDAAIRDYGRTHERAVDELPSGDALVEALDKAQETLEDCAPGGAMDPVPADFWLDLLGEAGDAVAGILGRAGMRLSDASAGYWLRVAKVAAGEGDDDAAVVALTEAMVRAVDPQLLESFSAGSQDVPANRLARVWSDWKQGAVIPTAERNGHLAGAPPIMIAGGVQSLSAPELKLVEALLKTALRANSRSLISGGTDTGVPGIVGRVASGNATTIGYKPLGAPQGQYDRIVPAGGSGFSTLQPLQAWADVIAAGHDPAEVRLLAFPGGAITCQEVAIARAFGARVGVVALGGLPAPGTADGTGAVVALPADAATIRAWLDPALPLAEDVRLDLARRVHAQYAKDQAGRKLDDDAAMAAFDALPESLQQSNLRQVDDLPAKLAVLGLKLAADGAGLHLDETMIEKLAEHEHGRWNAERLDDGWLLGPRNVALRTSPHLVAWEDLDETYKEYDREAVRAIPEILKSAEWGVCRC